MHDNITIEIDGERFELSPDGTGKNHDIQGQITEIAELGDASYQISYGDTLHKIKVVAFDLPSRTCTVDIDGQRKQVRILRDLDKLIEKMGLNTTHSKKQELMFAPMPGLVCEVKVAIGQHVEKGFPLLILEAMKMENVISAPHDAVIKAINVTVGQAVERGFPLVEFMKGI